MKNTDYGLLDFYGNLLRAMDIFNKDHGYKGSAHGVRSYLDYLYMGSTVGGFNNRELFPTFEIDLNQCKNWDDLDLRLKWDFSIDLRAIIQSSRKYNFPIYIFTQSLLVEERDLKKVSLFLR